MFIPEGMSKNSSDTLTDQVTAPGEIATIEEAIAEYRAGRMVIVMDDEDRENEGDLCMAAEKVTPEAINFMATEGCGLICLPLTGNKLATLGLPMMATENTAPPFGVSK